MSDHLLVRACRGEPVERTPVWAMRQAGRWDPEFRRIRAGMSFYEFSARPELAAAASLAPRRFGVDGIILFYDITTLAIAMGLDFSLEPNRGPVPARPVRSLDDAQSLAPQPSLDSIAHIIELVRIVRRELAGALPVLVFASAPFTLASYCIDTGKDVERTRQFIREQPKTWDLLCDRIAEATIWFLNVLCAEGADAYQLFDSWAGELDADEYSRWAQPFHRQTLAACRRVPSILFVRENPHVEMMTEAGATAVSLGVRHDLSAIQARYPNLVVQGNVDHELLVGGSLDQVREATERCLEQGGGRRHILNLNHGVDRDTPVENFAEFVRVARER